MVHRRPGPVAPPGGDLAGVLGPEPPRAASFIVTVYGDVVEPRGGVLWMGNLIEICASVGLSETLVRTAVSRLVAAGQLQGEKDGRRSYYRLTPAARVDFARAAQLLFGPPAPAQGWVLIARPDPAAQARLARDGFVPLGDDLLIGLDRGRAADLGGIVFRAELVAGAQDLPAFAAAHWDLGAHGQAYRDFVARFAPLSAALAQGRRLVAQDCLVARLALVHGYRLALLHDPRLPVAALPADWPGAVAQRLFADLYLALSDGADSYLGARLTTAEGPLPPVTEATRARLAALRALACAG